MERDRRRSRDSNRGSSHRLVVIRRDVRGTVAGEESAHMQPGQHADQERQRSRAKQRAAEAPIATELMPSRPALSTLRRDHPRPPTLLSTDVLALQRTIGNAAVNRLLRPGTGQQTPDRALAHRKAAHNARSHTQQSGRPTIIQRMGVEEFYVWFRRARALVASKSGTTSCCARWDGKNSSRSRSGCSAQIRCTRCLGRTDHRSSRRRNLDRPTLHRNRHRQGSFSPHRQVSLLAWACCRSSRSQPARWMWT